MTSVWLISLVYIMEERVGRARQSQGLLYRSWIINSLSCMSNPAPMGFEVVVTSKKENYSVANERNGSVWARLQLGKLYTQSSHHSSSSSFLSKLLVVSLDIALLISQAHSKTDRLTFFVLSVRIFNNKLIYIKLLVIQRAFYKHTALKKKVIFLINLRVVFKRKVR